jgi:hypothetical protein
MRSKVQGPSVGCDNEPPDDNTLAAYPPPVRQQNVNGATTTNICGDSVLAIADDGSNKVVKTVMDACSKCSSGDGFPSAQSHIDQYLTTNHQCDPNITNYVYPGWNVRSEK